MPLLAPFAMILTPMSGSPCLSVTLPEIFLLSAVLPICFESFSGALMILTILPSISKETGWFWNMVSKTFSIGWFCKSALTFCRKFTSFVLTEKEYPSWFRRISKALSTVIFGKLTDMFCPYPIKTKHNKNGIMPFLHLPTMSAEWWILCLFMIN